MAHRRPEEMPKNAQPGGILLAVHEFSARSPDEISLTKGDRIELIEKDDDFGDGWYLGKHMQTGNTGLFPEVYTIVAPKPAPQTQHIRQAPQRYVGALGANGGPRDPTSTQHSAVNAAYVSPPSAPPQTLPYTQPYNQPQQSLAGQRSPHQSSVMNEMHNVINEHITDLNKPRHLEPNTNVVDFRPASTGSDSHYSQDYIPGEETDEEEDAAAEGALTEDNVKSWTPEQVSSYLQSVGVEKTHCELFQAEEFTGEVILEMEQAQVFMKEFDLGPIGRRMKTWQKIKALQDEVKGPAGSQDQSMSNRAVSAGSTPTSPQAVKAARRSSAVYGTFPSSRSGALENRRPSAASIRDLGHSRRQSSIDQTAAGAQGSTTSSGGTVHGKQPSFDRGWTMGGQPGSISNSPRPTSTTHLQTLSSGNTPYGSTTASSQISLPRSAEKAEVDRGYVSGSEADPKRHRKVLRKRDTSGDQHKRISSFGSESRRSSKAFFWQKGRESRDGQKSPSEQEQSRKSQKDGVRIVSEPIQGQGSPTVTRLEYDDEPKPANRQSAPYGSKSGSATSQRASTQADSRDKPTSRRGIRAISDAVTGRERAIASQPSEKVLPSESTLVQSPVDGAPSPSASAEDSKQLEYSSTPQQTAASAAAKRKPKQQTSAYTRGLEKKSPQEQMVGADYSGWMKKKSSNIMTAWKPRLFILKGRRLSYYYSDTDTEEKGLIDISNHRVLNADGDFLTGLHASITKAHASSPTTPGTPASVSTSSTLGSNPYGAPTPTAAGDQGFIFKLVPPRTGLSKGVNFTKPSVHYFAVSSKAEGRMWMAALMKSTIDRDDSIKVVTTYQQKTISLEQARARRELPPFLKGVEEEPTEAGTQENGHEETANSSVIDGTNGVDTSSNFSKDLSSIAGSSTADTGTTTSTVPGSFNAPSLQKVQREGPADLPSIVTNLEQNGVVQSKEDADRTSQEDKGLGIQGLSSGVSNEPSSPILDKMREVGMY